MNLNNENILRITGKANIPRPLTLGKQYDITASVECDSYKVIDENDGTTNTVYTLRLLSEVNLISEKELIKAEVKKNSMSQILRLVIRDLWLSENSGEDLQTYYEKYMRGVIDEIRNKI